MLRIVLILGALALSALPAAAQEFEVPIPVAAEGQDVAVVVDRGLTKTKYLPTRKLRAARVAMLAKQVVSDEDLRALADRKDSLAALKYTQLLWQRGVSENASDIAYYGSIAAAAGRVSALKKMIRAMAYLDPATEPAKRRKQLMRVLYPYAWGGNSLALDALVEFNGEGKLFGALSERTRTRILDHAEGGDGRIELRMAVSLLQNTKRTPDDEAAALRLLERAQQSSRLSVKTTALNLIALVGTWQEERRIVTN
ncbi:hypothetical protein [Pseudaestuariivita atlantica]|uniref:Uncharacterized protein n=1 Tax=Pseudaestuariivita atlantica TaxID=1317121 RepID=A0A0L1JNJ7_9RHOB|nr:hypothetical protein [Pseudaestuariivita atlantica]KNG93297.1 hypothetical protein ATO11_12675 [Pseudaestuariivita atlantica]